jgi:3-oxoacyl-(acyl-carrier-protein) synthase
VKNLVNFVVKRITLRLNMKTKIAIASLASISPLGNNPDAIWQKYLSNETLISSKEFNGNKHFVATIPSEIRNEIEILKKSEVKYKSLDETVLMAILVSRQAIKNAGWKNGDEFGINIGSSRGATQLFEKYHKEFLETGRTATLASPTTTLGNISSWVAHDLKNNGPEISHSITCSTALHAVLNAVAWLQSGMATKFLVGGSEAPLTAFTIAQMHALKIYSKQESEFPCRAFDLSKTKNTMVLGEG